MCLYDPSPCVIPFVREYQYGVLKSVAPFSIVIFRSRWRGTISTLKHRTRLNLTDESGIRAWRGFSTTFSLLNAR